MWQSVDGNFLRQGKYAVEILKRFGIMDCKAMATPMAPNMKLLSDASSESVDTTMYRQMIESLMYARLDIFFAVKTLETCSPDGCKAYRGTVDYGIKYDVNQKINLEGYVDSDWASSAIDRKKHFQVLLQYGIMCDLLV